MLGYYEKETFEELAGVTLKLMERHGWKFPVAYDNAYSILGVQEDKLTYRGGVRRMVDILLAKEEIVERNRRIGAMLTALQANEHICPVD